MRRVLALALLMSWGLPSLAATYDPSLHWLTLDTEHFRIHFHDGLTPLALRAGRVAEEALFALSSQIDHLPRGRIDITLVDNTDLPNGFASTLPRAAITLYTVAPDAGSALDHHEDWLWALLVHELAHIVQMDQHEGIWTVLRKILGTLAMPSALLPGWGIEGYATFQETWLTGAGRGRASYTDTLFRVAAFSGTFPDLGQADGYSPFWPRGQTRYLFGGRFHLWLAATKGEETLRRYHRLHSRQVLPFVLPARKAFGSPFSELWEEWTLSEKTQARDWLAKEATKGLLDGPSTLPKEVQVSSIEALPDGSAFVALRSQDDLLQQVRLWSATTPESRALLRLRNVRGISASPVEEGLVLCMAEPSRYVAEFQPFWLDLRTRVRVPLSKARLRQPDIHPQGRRVVAVHSALSQSTLAFFTLPEGLQSHSKEQPALYWSRVTRLLRDKPVEIHLAEHPFDERVYDQPTWTPDGAELVVSMRNRAQGRQLWRVDSEGVLLEIIAPHPAADADPEFSPDGHFLLFASDRDGTWNLYAMEWPGGQVLRVTRAFGGARDPKFVRSMNGAGWDLLYNSLGPDGSELHRLPWTPDSLRPWDGDDSRWRWAQARWVHERPSRPLRAYSQSPSPEPESPPAQEQARSLSAFRERSQALAQQSPMGTSIRAYNPLPYLAPHTLYPDAFLTDQGIGLSLSTGGRDLLGWLSWRAGLTYDSASRFLASSFGITLRRHTPSLSLSYRAQAVDWGPVWLTGGEGDDAPVPSEEILYQRRDVASLRLVLPIALRQSIYLTYTLDWRRDLRPPSSQADPALLPIAGNHGGLVAGWTYSNVRSSRAALSTEQGLAASASARLSSRYLGSRVRSQGEAYSLEQVVLIGEVRGYIPMPWRHHHTLALRVGGGTTLPLGPKALIQRQTFRMGGPLGDSPYILVPDPYLPLRGYGTSSLRGIHMLGASAEYRFPLARIERGLRALPIYLTSIQATVFGDAGLAWDGNQSPTELLAQLRSSVGAEFTMRLILFWGAVFQIRTGTAFGFSSDALPAGLRSSYLMVGSSF